MSPPNVSVDDDFRWIMERVRADLPREVTPPRLEHGREAACLAVMSAVQDAVIDETGSPWPEVVSEDGRAVGVLDVHADPHGHAVWALGGDVVGPIGNLVTACAARGRHIT